MRVGDKVIVKVNDALIGQIGIIEEIREGSEKGFSKAYIVRLDNCRNGLLYCFYKGDIDEFGWFLSGEVQS